jgi:hypothetical protein
MLLGKLYSEKWLSTGISKGGMTTLFYYYFYPEDIDVAVPYVAPINLAFKDKRIYKFLDKVGTEECRVRIHEFQAHLLKNKDQYMPLIKWFAKGQRLTHDHLGFEKAYELAVLEYSFAFWQYGTKCERIPSAESGTDEILEHFMEVSGIDFFSDATIDGFAPFYYQMGTEMGYYGYDAKEFGTLIDATGSEPSAVFMPKNIDTSFNPELTRKTHKWLVNEAENIVYINGANDTWSATAVNPRKKLDVLVFNMKGKDHRSARIKNMDVNQLEILESTLERWLGLDVPTQLE